MRCDLINKYPKKAILETTERVSFFSDQRVWSCLNNIASFSCRYKNETSSSIKIAAS